MSLILAISLITSVLTVAMMWQLARKRRSGWILSLIAQPFWGYFNYLTEAWGFYILTVCMTVIALRGIVKWRDGAPESDYEADHLQGVDTLNWLLERFRDIVEETEGKQYVNIARTKFIRWAGKIDDTLDR